MDHQVCQVLSDLHLNPYIFILIFFEYIKKAHIHEFYLFTFYHINLNPQHTSKETLTMARLLFALTFKNALLSMADETSQNILNQYLLSQATGVSFFIAAVTIN